MRSQPYAHHHVVLSGLSPDTKYYYKVGDAAAGVSPVLSFTTAPASSASFNVVSVLSVRVRVAFFLWQCNCEIEGVFNCACYLPGSL